MPTEIQPLMDEAAATEAVPSSTIAHDLTAFTAETLDGPMKIDILHRADRLMLVLNGVGYILPPDRKVLMRIVATNRTTLKVDAKVLD